MAGAAAADNKASSVCEMDVYVKQIDIAGRLVHKADRESLRRLTTGACH